MHRNDLILALQKARVRYANAPNGELAINCVVCKDTKSHMRVNVSAVKRGIKGWGYCYKNGCTVTLARIVSTLGLKVKVETQSRSLTAFDQFEALMYNMGDVVSSTPPVDTSRYLLQYKKIVGNDEFRAKRALSYLKVRGFTESQIKAYKLMFSDTGDTSGRVIIPFFESGKLVYTQARLFAGNGNPKILNPPNGVFNGGKSEYLFNFDMASSYSRVVVCEGWASAITAGPNAVAIQGKVISQVQLRKLSSTWVEFVVMLDAGTELESQAVAQGLFYQNSQAVVRIVRLPDGDPNDYTFTQLQEFIAAADVYTSKDFWSLSVIRGVN